MTASADTNGHLAAAIPMASTAGPGARLPADVQHGQYRFKKHKNLPHPRKDSQTSLSGSQKALPKHDLSPLDTTSSSSASDLGLGPSPPSPRAPRHQARNVSSGPNLPPTPPAHSRTSSSSHSARPSSPTYVESPVRSTDDVHAKAPTTPINQKSPPTPDVTPPHAMSERRPRPFRPVITDRIPSKTTTDSRTESFKTARENPVSSDEDDGRSTLRPVLPSAKTSQSTVRQSPQDGRRKPQPVGLGLELELSADDSLTPRSKGDFVTFDGDWGGSNSEVEQEWDYNLGRNVTVRKRPARHHTNPSREVLEDATVSPTNATKAVRSMTLPERVLTFPSPQGTPDRMRPRIVTGPTISETSISTDPRRFSGVSSKSTVSTVVEAILVGTPPTRQRTLRHVRKNIALRDSNSDLSPVSSAPTSVGLDEGPSKRLAPRRYHDVRHDSMASTGTISSTISRKARRDVWKNGGIPVIIVPERQSSVKSSTEPSLRSTSSRRSKRSQSLHLMPLSQIPKSKDLTPLFDRPSRRAKPGSEADGSAPGDQRTMDYPPAVPRRTSSLSAPTSRNTSRAGSRTGSLTAESLKTHNVLQNELQVQRGQPAQEQSAVQPLPEVKLREAPSEESFHSARNHPDTQMLSPDVRGEASFGRLSRLSSKNTPFSQISVETNGTSHHSHAEVSEAFAVNIYPHQNTSVLMVDHSNRPSEVWPNDQSDDNYVLAGKSNPVIKTTGPDGVAPVTPPQPRFSLDDVDSPLRNPRIPPEPPMLKFIPATPSGLTPTQEKEKQLGNFFEETEERPERPEPPKRSMSLVRRALGQRRYSDYASPSSRAAGFLTRTLSLTRGTHRRTRARRNPEDYDDDLGPNVRRYSTTESEPADESRLHPHWRPSISYDDDDDDRYYDDNRGEDFNHEDDAADRHHYPPITRRRRAPPPAPPRRSFSARVKRTFAILPIERDPEDEDHYLSANPDGPERRTVRRTPSGALRVVKHRASLDSLRRYASLDAGGQQQHQRPYTAPEGGRAKEKRYFWQPQRQPRRAASDGSGGGGSSSWTARVFPGLGTKLVEYGPANLPRRLSEKRRERRTRELRGKISGPREVRDGVGDVIRRGGGGGGATVWT